MAVGTVLRSRVKVGGANSRRRGVAGLASFSSPRRRRARRQARTRSARLSLSEWWTIGLRTEDRRADAKRERGERDGNDASTSGSGEGSDKAVSLLDFVGIMFDLLRPYRAMFAFGLVTLVLAAGAELALPHFTAKTIFAIQKGNQELFRGCIRWLLGLSVAFSVTASMRGMTFGFLNQRFVFRLRTKLFENLLRQDITFHDQSDVGVLTSRLTSDCSSMSRILGMNINLLIRNVFKTIGGAAYLWFMSPRFFVQTLASLAVILLINVKYGQYSRKAATTEQEQLALGNQIATEVLTLIRTVRIFGTERSENTKYQKSLEHLIRIGTRQIVAYGMFLTSATFLVNATEALCLLYGGLCCLRGEITPEQLTSFLFYIEFVVQSALASSEQVANINTAVGSSERVLELLKRRPNDHLGGEESGGDGKVESFAGNIELRDVSFSYPDLNLTGNTETAEEPRMTLRNINLSLRPGTVTALVGPSGGGKSTLVSLLQYLYQPTSGAVLVDGVPLDELDPEWYRSQIGYVEQEPKLFDLPIGENIGYGTPGRGREDLERAAEEANALRFVRDLPDDLETWVGNSTLSGGQRQRIALARALIREPRILILDEATSALDAESEFQVQKALDRVFEQKDRTVVIVAHRLSTVMNADNIVVLKAGEVVEQGRHEDLMQIQGGVYQRLASKQGVVDLAPHCEPPTEAMKKEQRQREEEREKEEVALAMSSSIDEIESIAKAKKVKPAG